MLRLTPTRRSCTFWVLALALLLKAAVPMLASAAAELQGKTLVEVCTVYGVKTVTVDVGDAPGNPASGPAAHGGEHCALGSLVVGALNLPAGTDARVVFGTRTALPLPLRSTAARPDACAAWVAQLKQGPPRFT